MRLVFKRRRDSAQLGIVATVLEELWNTIYTGRPHHNGLPTQEHETCTQSLLLIISIIMAYTPGLVQSMANIRSIILDKHSNLFIFISILASFLLVTYRLVIKKSNHKLPDGPRPFPITGNIHQMLTQRLMEVVHKWHQDYGTMVAFRYGQQQAISISSFEIIKIYWSSEVPSTVHVLLSLLPPACPSGSTRRLCRTASNGRTTTVS